MKPRSSIAADRVRPAQTGQRSGQVGTEAKTSIVGHERATYAPHYRPAHADDCRDHRAAHRSGGTLRGRHRARGRHRDEGVQGPVPVAAGRRRAGRRPRRQDRSSSTATAASRSPSSAGWPTRWPPRCRDRFGVGHGDRVAVLSANNPEWCMAFWGTVEPRRHPRRPQRLVEERRDPLRADGLRGQGAGRRPPALRAHRRRTSTPARCPTSRPCSWSTPTPPTSVRRADPLLHRFDELTGTPTADPPDNPIDEDDPAVIFYTSGTTGRPKGAVSTHRNMIANLQNTVFNTVVGHDDRRAAARSRPATATAAEQPAALFTSPLFHVSGCHSTLGGRATWAASSWSCRWAASSPTTRSSSSHASRSASGRRCRRWCGGCASTPTATTTTRPR